MKHFTINRIVFSLNHVSRLNYVPRYIASTLLCFLGSFIQLNAQIGSCPPACSMGAEISMDADCILPLQAEDVLDAPPDCPGNYLLIMHTAAGATVANNIVKTQHVGKTLNTTVIHVETQSVCNGTIKIIDPLPPTLVCPEVTVACTQSTEPATTGVPTFYDNCPSSAVTLLPHNDNIMLTGTCNDPFAKRIMRWWSARDSSGNIGNCLQMITVVRPSLSDVVFPPRRDTIATGTVADPAVTGRPTIAGGSISMSTCNMFDNQLDFDTLVICQKQGVLIEYLIRREWLVVDNCRNLIRRDTQEILVKDLIPPTVVCPPATTFNTAPNLCEANIAALPAPTVSAPDAYTAQWPFGTGLGPWEAVPPGVYTVTYRAYDCSNTVSCTTKVTVRDAQLPTAACANNKVIGLSNNGTKTFGISFFNNGSYDNCDQVVMHINRGSEFGDNVTFDCADAGTQVAVTLRVKELHNAANFSTCTVLITVQDNIAPSLTAAPVDIVEVDCLADFNSPTLGTPVFTDNCGLDRVEYSTEQNLSACGSGTVLRKFRAFDKYGNSNLFVQTLLVSNENPITGAAINWPDEYQTTVCGASLAVNDLAVQFREPQVANPGCSELTMSYVDQFFNTAAPACYKVFRKWTVIDGCQFNASNPNGPGKWIHTQTLQVSDNQAPTLLVPAHITIGVGADCLKGQVTLANAVATDCSPSITITHNSAYAPQGVNASGLYPMGVHNITFRATDGCGNISQKTVKVTVADLTPTALCVNGLSVNLIHSDSTVSVKLNAAVFNAGSFDFCTPTNQLILNVKKVGSSLPPAPTVTYDCSELGTHNVELHVTDGKGNTAHCVTYIILQDNNGYCPSSQPTHAKIIGTVETETGVKIKAVTIKTANYASALPLLTDTTGVFTFQSLPLLGNYEVKPEKDGEDLNGVSSWDLSLLNKHITGVQPLTTPYKIIAADVSKNGTVSTFDMLELRKVILGTYTEIPNNTSWRFVHKNFQFANPASPLAAPFPESKMVNNLNADSIVNFIGIKIGDLNNSVNPQYLDGGSDDRDAELPAFHLVATQSDVADDGSFTLGLTPNGSHQLGAIAFTLEFDPTKVQITDWNKSALPSVDADHFNLVHQAEGRISFCWAAETTEGAAVQPTTPMLTFKGQLAKGAQLADAMHFSHSLARSEAFGANGEAMALALQFGHTAAEASPVLYQNQPNPFSNTTSIGFYLPSAKMVTLSVFDLTGRLVYTSQKPCSNGVNTWEITGNEWEGKGVFAYRLQTDNWTASRKMIKQ